MIKVALLGAGRIGAVHAKAIAAHAGSTLVSISDIYEPAAQKLADQYGCEARDIDAVMSDAAIDAVLIATSTDTHSDLIERATAAGKAVLCEKPVDLDLARAKACLQKAQAAGQPVMVGFNRRFDPSFGELKRALDAGEIGETTLLSITSFDPAPPPLDYIKVSGGMFKDMTIHDFDIANWLMGALPEMISVAAASLIDPAIGEAGDVDTAVITLKYADGRIAVIRNSRQAAYGYDQRIEVLGSKGLLEAQNKTEHSIRKWSGDGINAAKPLHFFLERYMPAYEAEWSAFVDGITSGTMPVALQQGVEALAMGEAATQSHKTGQPVALAPLLT